MIQLLKALGDCVKKSKRVGLSRQKLNPLRNSLDDNFNSSLDHNITLQGLSVTHGHID